MSEKKSGKNIQCTLIKIANLESQQLKRYFHSLMDRQRYYDRFHQNYRPYPSFFFKMQLLAEIG